MTNASLALRLVPSLDDEICVGGEPTIDDTLCYLRWRYPEMIDCLDDRLRRQQELVTEILKTRGWTSEELLWLPKSEVEELGDETLVLCWNILRDIQYINSLR